MGNVGDGQGEGGSSLMKDRSGYLLTSMSATLSGDEDGTKPSGLLRPEESWTLKTKEAGLLRPWWTSWRLAGSEQSLPELLLVVVRRGREGRWDIHRLGRGVYS